MTKLEKLYASIKGLQELGLPLSINLALLLVWL